MFKLHDKTRRRICIGAFLALCILPTILVSVWCISRHTSAHAQAAIVEIEARLGLSVKLDDVEYLRPGAVLYRGLELNDPETGQTVLRCRVLEAVWQSADDDQGQSKPVLMLTASQPEVEAKAFEHLCRLADRVLRGNTEAAGVDVRFAAGELTFKADADSQTLTDVRGTLEPSTGGTQAEVSFQLAGIEMNDRARIRIVRNRQVSPPQTGFELFTGGIDWPCSTLAIGLPMLKPLGPRARFNGHAWATQAADGWASEIAGRLSDVPLGNLISDRFPHKLSGDAQIDIKSARLTAGRLQQATGTISAGPGVVGRSLLVAAVESMNLTPGFQPETLPELVAYEKFATGFTIDAAGLSLVGRCDLATPGAILVDRYRPLLSEPPQQPQPVVALLRTLVPLNEVQVPATVQTDWLIRRLPVPAIVPPSTAADVPPTARLRLSEPGAM